MTPEEHRMLKNIERKTENTEALLIALIGETMLLGILWVIS